MQFEVMESPEDSAPHSSFISICVDDIYTALRTKKLPDCCSDKTSRYNFNRQMQNYLIECGRRYYRKHIRSGQIKVEVLRTPKKREEVISTTFHLKIWRPKQQLLMLTTCLLAVTECPIAKLADEDLAAIFKHLPPFERLIVSEVSTKWRDISKTPWHDFTHLDLSRVPTANIHAVIKKCTNLTSVSALRQNLGDLGCFVSRLSNTTSLKCVECTFTTDGSFAHRVDVGVSIRSASWEELIWHNSKTVTTNSNREFPLPYANPSTLRRLQLSLFLAENVGDYAMYDVLRDLPLLESCIVADIRSFTAEDSFFRHWFSSFTCSVVTNFARLRELYLDWANDSHLTFFLSALHQLKVLYLNNVDFQRTDVKGLLTQHASLCVLVITASRALNFNDEVLVPARKLFPNGFNAPPVPQLHLFLGKIAAERLRFHQSPSDALKIYPIDAPLPEFFEKAEIKPIFEGSWIASRIKEGAKEGVNLADYSFEGNAESISYVQE